MESSKVKLPKEVAVALNNICVEPTNTTIYSKLLAYETHWREQFPRMMMDDILKALVNGYEVEQTPEDKVRELYDEYKTNEQKARVRNDTDAEERLQLAGFAIRETLDALNIKIKGVNAE